MKFFDKNFVLKCTKHKGTPIWKVETSFLRWMKDKARDGMEPLEYDIITAFIEDRIRWKAQKLAKEKETEEEEDRKKESDQNFYAQAGLPPDPIPTEPLEELPF